MALFLAVQGQQNPSDRSRSEAADQLQRVAIIGAVRTPSRFDFRENLHLNELITCAGGLADNAGTNLQIVHLGEPSCRNCSGVDFAKLDVYSLAAIVSGEKESDPVIYGGDIIVVLESDPIFVIGCVVRPQPISSKGPITLTQAIALAGGVTGDGKPNRINVFRQSIGSLQHTIFRVDLTAIKKHRAVDPILQPFDIIEVPGEPHGDVVHGPIEIELFKDLPLRGVCRINF